MAMMDNVDFLIAHVRHSFLTSDDTGMAEAIIECDNTNNNNNNSQGLKHHTSLIKRELSDQSDCSDGLDSLDGDLSRSNDILPDMDFGAHRRRSNTAQRLDVLRRDKQAKGKIKTITWKDAPSTLSAEERQELFGKQPVPADVDLVLNKMSKLSRLIEDFNKHSNNAFQEYAKYDGRSSVGATKKIEIFLTMAYPADRPYPLTVVVMSTAKVQDLIGLICWQYTCEGREPKLLSSVSHYCLHIAEDDGEVDGDFPSLDNREPVSKFGFNKLALMECTPTPVLRSSFVVTVNVPNRGFNKFQLDSLNVPMRTILEKVINRRKIRTRPGLHYNLEKQSEPGVAVDLDTTLAHMDTMEFCLVRENSTRGDLEENNAAEASTLSNVADTLTSHQYKSYMVTMIHKLRANTEVQLGISGEKVEIDPVQVRSTLRLIRQKPLTYSADSIADCHILDKKPNGRGVFRLVYFTEEHSYKHHDFEAETSVAVEIEQKLKNILELRLSPVRKDFISVQDRKLKKRDSLKFSLLQ